MHNFTRKGRQKHYKSFVITSREKNLVHNKMAPGQIKLWQAHTVLVINRELLFCAGYIMYARDLFFLLFFLQWLNACRLIFEVLF